MTASQPQRRIFLWPTIIGLASLIGLLSALIGDGTWDGLSWAMLAVPVGISLTAARRGRRRRPAPT
jgi:hypothetical protein